MSLFQPVSYPAPFAAEPQPAPILLAVRPDKAFNWTHGKPVNAVRPQTMADLLQSVVRIPEDQPVFLQ